MTTFPEWLQAELDKRRLTPSEITEAGGPKLPTLTRILNGERGVGAASARKIAKALHYPEEYVMEKAGIMSPTYGDDDPPSLKELTEVARRLTDAEREELTYIALGKLDRHEAGST